MGNRKAPLTRRVGRAVRIGSLMEAVLARYGIDPVHEPPDGDIKRQQVFVFGKLDAADLKAEFFREKLQHGNV
jgi:hypothetical protein